MTSVVANNNWKKRLATQTKRLPAIFLAHGSPLLLMPKSHAGRFAELNSVGGPDGPHAQFLRELGPFLLQTYKPKAIVVFSAHWETNKRIQITDYEKNHLLYDYYGFPKEMYELKFESNGSHQVALRVEELLTSSGIAAERIQQGRGLDHGVFIPFILMFGNKTDVPIVEVSMPSSLDPRELIRLGKALVSLRDEGVLLISGGLTIHSFEEMEAWDPDRADPGFKDFENCIKTAIQQTASGADRNEQLVTVTSHPFFRRAHPREEHFVPLYIASGAGAEDGDDAVVVSDLHGALTIAFGA